MEDVRRASQKIEPCAECGQPIYWVVNSNNFKKTEIPKPTAFDKGTHHIHKIRCGMKPRDDFSGYKPPISGERSSVGWS